MKGSVVSEGSHLAKRIPIILRKLDDAREALEELSDLLPREDGCRAADGRCQLASSLSEFADYLEKATWWKKKI